jgi:hypothetical protein
MSTEGLSMMLITEITVTLITAYFFFKILFTKKHEEPDSYIGNDDEIV